MTAGASLGWHRILHSVLLGCVVVLMAACSAMDSTRPMLALLFDIPPPGQEPPSEPAPRQPRRTVREAPSIVISKEYVEMMEALIKAGEPPNWPAIFKKLPKDDEDNIDWMAALESKAIAPSGVIDAKAKDEGKTTDDDIELATSGKPVRYVTFSHGKHTQWLTCANCHNAIFKREAGSAKITMEDIDNGKYCGVCHDKVAVAQPSGCKGCHKVKPKPKAKEAKAS
ncbi:MAG: cytochrome c3 family protein [Burkholderiaceae bacterium]|nr:cytochrome c3 family protein [Burkholderiaceae bacterium]